MMKKITLLLILLTVSYGYSQSSPLTFATEVTVYAASLVVMAASAYFGWAISSNRSVSPQ